MYYLLFILFYFIPSCNAQTYTPEQFLHKVSISSVGDIVQKKNNFEIRKMDNKGTLNAKIFGKNKYDEAGNPLLSYDVSTHKITTNTSYVRYIPDNKTSLISVERLTTEEEIKETYIIEDNTTTVLSWSIETNLVLDDINGVLVYTTLGGESILKTPLPIAYDSQGIEVPVSVVYNDYTLQYKMVYTEDTSFPVYVDPSTTKLFSPGAGIYGTSTSYTTARTTATTRVAAHYCGQRYAAPNYVVFRSFFKFNLSTLTNYNVSACSLYVWIYQNYSTTDFTMRACSAYADTVLDTTFTKFFGYNASGAHTPVYIDNGTGISSTGNWGEWRKIIFSTAGNDSVTAHCGNSIPLRIVLLSDRDIAKTTPSDDEYGTINWNDDAYLSFTYSVVAPSTTSFGPFKPLLNGVPTPVINTGSPTPWYKGN